MLSVVNFIQKKVERQDWRFCAILFSIMMNQHLFLDLVGKRKRRLHSSENIFGTA